MLNRLIVSTTVLLGLTVCPGIAAAQQPGRQMVPVAKDVYFMTGAGSNASFVVTDEGVLVFDSDIRNNDLPFIRKVTDKKVAYLFASHASGDHSTGAWYFREDKPVYIGTRDQNSRVLSERAEGIRGTAGAEGAVLQRGWRQALSAVARV
jgi:glyoxylase-like metal-dependent hydrolase (beta-lactamase superfamily II)